ncbi:MAG: putative DNA-binding domain-containing protein [Gammaproteobacteria bacterium]|nr:putative DNA-binding domain-containing protein [Gammaproteobacteria bacterium]
MSASPDTADFRTFQTAFAARIRDPRNQSRPRGVPARRMRVYEELLFNNLEGFLLACFPITRTLLGARAWRRTVRRFFIEHRCASPLFRDIPDEFLAWLEPLAEDLFPQRPYLYEFMHYEWLELAVSISPENAAPVAVDPDRDLLSVRPILNHTAQLACYRYPVHRIGPRFKVTQPDGQVYGYLLYRDREDVVRFMELNPVSARVVGLLRDTDLSGDAIMRQIARELDHSHPELIIEMGSALLDKLRGSGAVY